MSKSIRFKLWLIMMGAVSLVILLIFVFQIIFLDRFYADTEIIQINRTCRKIVEDIESLDKISDISTSFRLISKIEEITFKKQLIFRILELESGNVIEFSSANSNFSQNMMRENLNEILKSASSGRVVTEEANHHRFNNKLLFLGFPIYNEAEEVSGALAVVIPMAPVDYTIDILRKQLIVILSIAFFISIWTSSKLSKSFTKPILEIRKVADDYTRGDFEQKLNYSTKDELGDIANKINQMGVALSKNEVLKRRLISNVSHELRTPLTIIRGYAETLRDITGDDEDTRNQELEVIINQSKRLANIVEDVLSLSKLESGTDNLKLETFSIYELLENIRRMYEMNADGRTFHLQIEEAKEYMVFADKGKIEQVLHNFISNALRHTNIDENVSIKILEKGNQIRVEVVDEGDGIPEDDLEYIFERYYKARQGDERKYTGTGLGLAIVKSILDLHDVKYGVETTLGEGSKFWFELKKA